MTHPANLQQIRRSHTHPRAHHLIAILAAAAFLTLSTAALAAPPTGPQVGTNLGFLDYSSGEWPFVDVFKTSSRWFVSGTCGWDCSVQLDDEGWIESLADGDFATTYIFSDVSGQMPHITTDSGHDYHVFYDGIGVLDYEGATVISQSSGHDVVRVDPESTQPFSMTLVRTTKTFDPEVVPDPDEYVRNIRIIAPGGVCSDDPFQSCMSGGGCTSGVCDLFAANDNYATQVFHPDFLNNVRNYDVFRMLDWMDTVETEEGNYDGYPTESSARWSRAPATVMADLANRLQADLWLNIPHVADSSFAAGFAADLVPALASARNVYLEFSGETWNSEFPVYAVATSVGCTDYPALDCDDDDDAMTARARYTVDRAIEIWDAFAAAFDAQSAGSSASRLVRVLASRLGDSDLHDALLSHRDVHSSTDALAVGGYFGWSLGGNGQVQQWDETNSDHMDDFFALLSADLNDTIADMTYDHIWLATSYSSVPLVLYEGGQGLVAYGPNAINSTALAHANRVFEEANNDQRMGLLYEQLLLAWLNSGGGVLFNHYVNCRAPRAWGSYGALDHQRQVHATSEKYTALMSFISGLP